MDLRLGSFSLPPGLRTDFQYNLGRLPRAPLVLSSTPYKIGQVPFRRISPSTVPRGQKTLSKEEVPLDHRTLGPFSQIKGFPPIPRRRLGTHRWHSRQVGGGRRKAGAFKEARDLWNLPETGRWGDRPNSETTRTSFKHGARPCDTTKNQSDQEPPSWGSGRGPPKKSQHPQEAQQS